MAYGPYGIITRLDDYQQQDMESGLMPGSAYMMGLRLSPLTTASGTAAQIELYDNEQLVFGSSTDAYIDWDASNLVVTQATARAGSVKLSNIGMTIGVSGTPIDLSTSTTYRGLEVYTTSASANASTSIRPIYMYSIMTGAGGVGGRAEFHMYTNAALGGWCNAVKAYTEFGASGRVTGLASALCAEIKLTAGTTQGNYAALELEMVLGNGCSLGTKTAMIYANTSDSAASTFDTSGYFLTMADGITAGSGKFCSANYHTLRCYFTDAAADRYLFFSQTENGLGIGASGSNVSFSQGSPLFSMYSTCSSEHASNSVEPFYVYCDMTGAAGVGGRARFHMYTNVALGGWSNALKAYAEYGASGRTTGLGSALCAEMYLSAGTTSGTYAPLESELTGSAGLSTGTSTSFLYCNIGGDGEATLNANAFFFEIGAGVTGDSGEMWEAEDANDIDATHVLKVKVAGTTMYIPMSTSKAFDA